MYGDNKREVYEIKKTTQDMKEKYNKDMESLGKKTVILEIKNSLNKVKNIVERHSSILEHVEDTFQGLKTK
jgi:hypothetical protein